jgi:hypothetical protein
MINLLYAFHSGGNCQYFDHLMEKMEGPDFHCEIARPKRLIPMTLKEMREFDVIVYQTFPDEKHWKFKPDTTKQLDKKFMEFPGFKILFDSHDWPEMDGFTRFHGEYPRIKHIPGTVYAKNHEIVLAIPHKIMKRLPKIPAELNRTVKIHYAPTFGVYPHRLRELIDGMLHDGFKGVTCFDRIDLKDYEEFLRTVDISISADGFGPSAANIQSLQSGALLYVHEHAIRDIQLLPHADLVDGEDYVSFDLISFPERLSKLLSDPKRRDRIRRSGQRKFFEGFDLEKSAKQFRSYLKEHL